MSQLSLLQDLNIYGYDKLGLPDWHNLTAPLLFDQRLG